MKYSDSDSPFIGLTFFSEQRLVISINYPREIAKERDKLLLTKLSEFGIQIEDYTQFVEIANERITKVQIEDYVHIFLDYHINPKYVCSWRDERKQEDNKFFTDYSQGYWPEFVFQRRERYV